MRLISARIWPSGLGGEGENMEAKERLGDWVPRIRPGTYSDGHPLDTVHYLESKLLLKPDRFTARPTFYEFGKLVRRAAENLDIEFSKA
jgi:hypothetical protein